MNHNATSKQTDKRAPHALLTGGKSGGHVFPALAVADELERRGWTVSYAGRAESMESRLASSRGIDFHEISAQPLVGTSITARVRSLATLLMSSLAARRLVKRLTPQVVFGTGGFVSAPAVLGARLAGVPVLLLEPNAEVGVANRLLSRFARCAAISFERAASQLHCETFVSGVPVRREFFEIEPSREDLSDQVGPSLSLLLLGGSQGSLVMNRHLPGALRAATADGHRHFEVEVVHQAGRDHVPVTRQAYCDAFGCSDAELESTLADAGIRLELVPFIDDVPQAFARARVLVSRAGAITLAEICAAGRASILIPLRLAGGHQGENAAAMVQAGAAVVVAEDTLEQGALARVLTELFAAPVKISEMAACARRLAISDARERIVDRLESLAENELGVAA